ncbi:hypothetical protein [Streptomyces sp. 049-1]|uniref:hypothetical protein n=1 Tax=Streptomyces sp. 049-1 TaxID=2789264 RepID=UPI00398152AD
MTKLTEMQVLQAEANAAEQERARDAADAELKAQPYSDMAALKLTEESRLAAQLRANAREMREAYEAQVTEERRRAERPELERAAAAGIKAARADMAERHEEFVRGLAQAQDALVGLVAVAAAYNASVEQHADALAGAGLDRRGGVTGGERDVLGGAHLKLAGVEYRTVNEGAVPAWLLQRVVEARVSRYHHLARALDGAAAHAVQAVPEVLAEVSAPKPVVREKAPRVVNAYQAMVYGSG